MTSGGLRKGEKKSENYKFHLQLFPGILYVTLVLTCYGTGVLLAETYV